MKELNIIICDQDAVYAKALVQAFQRKKAFEANYIILTDKNKILSYIKEGQALLYLVGEEAYEDRILPYSKELKDNDRMELEKKLFLLTDHAKTVYDNIQCIFKYQPVNGIIEPVSAWILENHSYLTKVNQNVKVIGVLDYAGESAALFGHLAAKIYSESRQVLLVNMELFPFLFQTEKTEYTLSDYIYAVSTGSDCMTQIVKGMQFGEGNLHYVSPVQCFEDLYELKDGDMSNFLKQLKEQCGCEVIIVVIDFLRSFGLELLSGCDAIISCEGNTLVSARKREQLHQMLTLEQKEWLLEKMSYCNVTNEYLLLNLSKEGEVSSQARQMFYEYLATLIN